ncbi:MAG: hypothetical protein ACKOWN_05390, partial [Microbacteriaceae bacterium]
YIGRSHWCDPGLDGSITYLRVYERALSADEVFDNYTYDDSTQAERDAAAQSGSALASTGFDSVIPAMFGFAGLIAGIALRRIRRRR